MCNQVSVDQHIYRLLVTMRVMLLTTKPYVTAAQASTSNLGSNTKFGNFGSNSSVMNAMWPVFFQSSVLEAHELSIAV